MHKFLQTKFRLFVSLLLILGASPGPLLAKNDLQSTFPYRFGRWVATTSPIKIKYTEPDYSILTEAGVEESFVRPYQGGSQTIGVILTTFRDPSGAYEAYTRKITSEMHVSPVGELVVVGPDRLLMLVGNVLVDVSQPQASTAELQELAGLVRKFADPTPLPPIRTYLPSGFADGTQRYALGPVAFQEATAELGRGEYGSLAREAGFKSNAEAMFARYRNGKDEAVLLLIEYPTPQLAGQHLKHLEQALTPDMKKAGTTIAQRASLLSIVLAPSSQEYAQKLRDAVSYDTEVTWNEPTHTLTDPPLLSTVGKIILFTGGFMVVAFVLGLAFGGVRILTKIFFPGKVFDRPEKMDVLQLGLTDKPIDFRDFY